ncbi:MAG: DUF4176 domain-containing protein [Candidatus Coprovivens sp.]
MRDKYLPIGSVVLLKGGKKRAMITGFCSVAQENQEKIYDYSGCVYPEGYLSSNQVCLFDHDQIDKIFFTGFEDEEEFTFKEKLNQIVSTLDSNNTETLSVGSFNGNNTSESLEMTETLDENTSSSGEDEIKPFAGL